MRKDSGRQLPHPASRGRPRFAIVFRWYVYRSPEEIAAPRGLVQRVNETGDPEVSNRSPVLD